MEGDDRSWKDIAQQKNMKSGIGEESASDSSSSETPAKTRRNRGNVVKHSRDQRIRRAQYIDSLTSDARTSGPKQEENDRNLKHTFSHAAVIRTKCFTRTNYLVQMLFACAARVDSQQVVEIGDCFQSLAVIFDPAVTVTMPEASTHYSRPSRVEFGRSVFSGLPSLLTYSEGYEAFCCAVAQVAGNSFLPVTLQTAVRLHPSTFVVEGQRGSAKFTVSTVNAVLCGGTCEFEYSGMVYATFSDDTGGDWDKDDGEISDIGRQQEEDEVAPLPAAVTTGPGVSTSTGSGVERNSSQSAPLCRIVSADLYFNTEEVHSKIEACFGAGRTGVLRCLSKIPAASTLESMAALITDCPQQLTESDVNVSHQLFVADGLPVTRDGLGSNAVQQQSCPTVIAPRDSSAATACLSNAMTRLLSAREIQTVVARARLSLPSTFDKTSRSGADLNCDAQTTGVSHSETSVFVQVFPLHQLSESQNNDCQTRSPLLWFMRSRNQPPQSMGNKYLPCVLAKMCLTAAMKECHNAVGSRYEHAPVSAAERPISANTSTDCDGQCCDACRELAERSGGGGHLEATCVERGRALAATTAMASELANDPTVVGSSTGASRAGENTAYLGRFLDCLDSLERSLLPAVSRVSVTGRSGSSADWDGSFAWPSGMMGDCGSDATTVTAHVDLSGGSIAEGFPGGASGAAATPSERRCDLGSTRSSASATPAPAAEVGATREGGVPSSDNGSDSGDELCDSDDSDDSDGWGDGDGGGIYVHVVGVGGTGDADTEEEEDEEEGGEAESNRERNRKGGMCTHRTLLSVLSGVVCRFLHSVRVSPAVMVHLTGLLRGAGVDTAEGTGAAAILERFLVRVWRSHRLPTVRVLLHRYEACMRHLDGGSGSDNLPQPRQQQQQKLASENLSTADYLLHRALSLDPHFAFALHQRAGVSARRGRWQDALSHTAQASRIEPSYFPALCAQGRLLQSTGRFAEALQCYHKAVEANPLLLRVASLRRHTDQCREAVAGGDTEGRG